MRRASRTRRGWVRTKESWSRGIPSGFRRSTLYRVLGGWWDGGMGGARDPSPPPSGHLRRLGARTVPRIRRTALRFRRGGRLRGRAVDATDAGEERTSRNSRPGARVPAPLETGTISGGFRVSCLRAMLVASSASARPASHALPRRPLDRRPRVARPLPRRELASPSATRATCGPPPRREAAPSR